MESAIAGLDQLICIIKLQSTNTYLLSLVDEKRAMLVFSLALLLATVLLMHILSKPYLTNYAGLV
jgi:hypothetical protein